MRIWSRSCNSQSEIHPCTASSSPWTSFSFTANQCWEKFQTNTVIRFLWRLDKITLWLKTSLFQGRAWGDQTMQSSKTPHNCNCTVRHVHHPCYTDCMLSSSLIYLSLHQTLSWNKEGLFVQFGQTGHNRVSGLLKAMQETYIRRVGVFLMLG